MRPGTLVADRFEIEKLAGAGGMGRVYRARDRVSGAPVALKVLSQQSVHDDARFGREIETLARLEHGNIVRYVAHGRVPGGAPFLAMEWVDGQSLVDRIALGPLDVRQTLDLAMGVADALGLAHQHGIVHRDIKPSNLHLAGGDPRRPKVLDFGTARLQAGPRALTLSGMIIGTPGFMSPEQARGEGDIDARADVFALGCVLFECLTGQPAFTGATLMAILAKVVLGEAPRLAEARADVPAGLDELLARMLAKEPAGRPENGAVLLAELRALVEPARESEPIPVVTPRAARPRGVGSSEQRLLSVLLSGPGFDRASADGVRGALAPWGANVELLADGTLLSTLQGQEVATDLAARAARSALAIRALAPHAWVSVATGRGAAGQRGPIGEAADRAAAVWSASHAGPPAAAVDEVTAGLLDARFVTEPGDGVTLLTGEREAPESPRPLLGRSTPFVGRDAELAFGMEVANACAAGPGARALLVLAPAGAGKSRLRLELLARLRAHAPAFEVLQGRGDPMAIGSPFGLLAQMVRGACSLHEGEPLSLRHHRLRMRVAQRVPMAARVRVAEFLAELAGSPMPDRDSPALRSARRDPLLLGDQIRRAVLDWLAAETAAGPVAVILEDLHWGDLPTVQVVNAALRELADRPLLVLAFARPDVTERFEGLWAEHAPLRVELPPLGEAAIRALAEVALDHALGPATLRRIAERSEGNAFFVEELLRAEATGQGASAPTTVLAMLHGRLDALPPAPRRVLRAASVFGNRFWTGGVQDLVGASHREAVDEQLDDLADRELVVARLDPRFPGEREWAFRHALVRETAYGMLTDEDRVRSHGRAAAWLERAGERDPLVLAEHVERGGDTARAPELYRRAAAQALEGNDFEAAIARAERGIACGPAPEVLGDLRCLQAEAHGWRGELAQAEARGLAAMAVLPAGAAGWYRAVAEVASAAGPQGHRAILLDLYHGLADAAARQAPGAEEIAAAARLARQLLFAGLVDEARGLVARLASALADLVDRDPVVAGRIHYTRALLALFGGDPGAYLQRCEAALASFEQAGDVRNACALQSFVGFARLEVGKSAEAETALREALTSAERLGLGAIAAHARHNLGLALARQGALEEARTTEERAVAELARQGDRRLEGGARIYLATIHRLAGDLAAAEPEARRAVAVLAGTTSMRPYALACLAGILLAAGRTEEARTLAEEAARALDQPGGVEEGESRIRLTWARVLDAAGEHERAHAELAKAAERLLARAAAIADPELRASFLRGIPENARTLEAAGVGGGS